MGEKPFAEMLGRIPYGVSVVTVGVGGAESGLTVSWLSQLAFQPPSLAFSIHRQHYSVSLLRDHPHFVVNLLRADQAALAARFAKTAQEGESKLDGLSQRPAPSEVPILTEALAYFDCEVTATHEVGDHLLVIGQVRDAGVLRDGEPLTSASGLRYR